MSQLNQGKLQITFIPDPFPSTSATVSWEFFPGVDSPSRRYQSRFTIPQGIPSLLDENVVESYVRTIGEMLFEELFNKDDQSAMALDDAMNYAIQTSTPLSLEFQFDAKDQSFASLPWEILRNSEDNIELLISSPENTGNCTRFPLTKWSINRNKPSNLPLRVLIVEPQLSFNDQSVRFKDALSNIEELRYLIDSGMVVIDEIEPPVTLEKTTDYIQQHQNIHVLHFSGKGGSGTGEASVFFDDGKGSFKSVYPGQFRSLFQKVHTAVLFADRTGRSGDKPLSSIAAALSAAGVPFVFGMQFAFNRERVLRSSTILYREFALGKTHQEALSLVRQDLYVGAPSRLDWASPVLFIRRTPSQPERPLIDFREEAYQRLIKAEEQLASIGAEALLRVVREQKRQLEETLRGQR